MNLFEIIRNVNKLESDDIAYVIGAATTTLVERGEGYEVVHEDDVESSTVEETIEHEGVILRKVDRECKTGDFVRFNNYWKDAVRGRFYEVVRGCYYIDESGDSRFEVNGWGGIESREIFEVVEPVKIMLEARSKAVEATKTKNQQRAELIQHAGEFVENEINVNGNVFFSIAFAHCNPEFIVNSKNRMVTVLLRGCNTKNLLAEGIAKCNPSDVFNADISKAIALARALEIDIPREFLNAVQPTEFEVGQVTALPDGELLTVTRIESNKARLCNEKFHWFRELNNGMVRITEDTNAVYGDFL